MVEKNALIKYVIAKLTEGHVLAKSYTEVKGLQLNHRRVYSRVRKHVDDFLLGEVENRLIVLPGLRGVGKTTVVFQICNYLRNSKKIEHDRILYFSADELKALLNGSIIETVKAFVEEVHRSSFAALDKELFVFVDEAHFDKEWSQAAKVIFDQSKKIFLIFTGSSALSMEMSVDIARRARREAVFPLNFSEYLILKYNLFPPKNTAQSIREVFLDYKNTGSAELTANEIMKKLIGLGKPPDKEWEDFLCYMGFPFCLNLSQIEAHERIFSTVERVIDKDVFSLQSFNTGTKSTITRVLSFLALQKPGGTSDAKLAERLQVSPTQVRSILDVLEKTHLIFSVKPYGSAGKVVRKPWKYYFLSPSINAALRFKLGSYNINDREMMGVLAENLAASYFFRMMNTVNMPAGIFYDSDENGADFILRTGGESIIPVSVTVGDKGSKQVSGAMEKYGSSHGIVISGRENFFADKNIVYMPVMMFSFV